MKTKLYSFDKLFGTLFETDEGQVELEKIVIPRIQRDYAQGRKNAHVNRVRNRFLDALHDAVTSNPIVLDFIYGNIDSDGTMTPLDGQQRLTTLFLLYWYASKKENVSTEKCEFLNNFSYATRPSARDFCEELVGFAPSFEEPISEDILNQEWFPLEWKKDPTISSMLVMIDAIADKFSDVADIWSRLTDNAINFYFLPIKDMGLTDELYIKMNSRGKALTQFEHFKAELEREICKDETSEAKRIIRKIDGAWTDLLWRYRNSGSGTEDDFVIDDEFLRYFRFICDVICYENGESVQGRDLDEFDLLQKLFSSENPDAAKHLLTVEKYFDCWTDIDGFESPTDFLKSFMTDEHEDGKICVDTGRYAIDIFEDCLHYYTEKRQFPLSRTVLLYAIISYLQNCNEINRQQFIRRIRIINNLIQNSVDEIADRAERNRMPAILRQTKAIMLTGTIDDTIELSYNVQQISEEKEKIQFAEKHPGKAKVLFELEDHPMLKGQIGIVGLDNLNYADRFKSLFMCDWNLIDRALMAIGDYSQHDRNRWTYQVGSSKMQFAWDELFHRSAAKEGFENTREVLIKLLSKYETFNNKTLHAICREYKDKCKSEGVYPWNYYYIKYDAFRPGSYGKLSNPNKKENPYEFTVLQTRSYKSQNSYDPYLFETDEEHISRDWLGEILEYENGTYINCHNDCFCVLDYETDELIETIEIKQNDDGFDTEDRVKVLKRYVKKHWDELTK